MSILTNIHRHFVYDPLNSYISLVNNSEGLIISYSSTLISYIYQDINQLIKDQFNLVDRLSCYHVGCQAIPRTLEDKDYIITLL